MTSRRSDCIYCGAPTGSREHSFPAGLGGRRVNKGILCEACNNEFSGLDARLSDQLNIVNGLLGVRPDHATEPKGAHVVDEATTEQYILDATGKPAMVAPQILSEVTVGAGKQQRVCVSSEKQAQDYVASMKAQGYTVRLAGRQESPHYFTNPMSIKWAFGGTEAFREIGRIALNYLAHHFPDSARNPSLAPFKEYVRGLRNADWVWYDFDAQFPVLPPPTFPFGHRIVLSLNAKSGLAFAHIELFSAFKLSVDLGKLQPADTVAVVVDIDPLAEHPPEDIKEWRLPEVELTHPPRPAAPRGAPAELQDRLTGLFQKIGDRQWGLLAAGLVPRLNATRNVPSYNRLDAIRELLHPYRQGILNLFQHCIQLLKEQFHDKSEFKDLLPLYDFFVQPDQQKLSGLTHEAECMIELARYDLAECILARLQMTDIDSDWLRQVLAGGIGLAIVGKRMTDFVMNFLRSAAPPCSDNDK